MIAPIFAISFGLITTKNAHITTEIPIQIFVHVTIVSIFPCFPAYFAPTIANKIDGSIPITVRIVEIPIFPMIIPFNNVTITAGEAVTCAILSDAAEMI